MRCMRDPSPHIGASETPRPRKQIQARSTFKMSNSRAARAEGQRINGRRPLQHIHFRVIEQVCLMGFRSNPRDMQQAMVRRLRSKQKRLPKAQQEPPSSRPIPPDRIPNQNTRRKPSDSKPTDPSPMWAHTTSPTYPSTYIAIHTHTKTHSQQPALSNRTLTWHAQRHFAIPELPSQLPQLVLLRLGPDRDDSLQHPHTVQPRTEPRQQI